jgi:predicted ATPase/class 3 adenylate cyclase
MAGLPTGTVTFLFTDIEGSTALLQQLKDAYPDVLMECRRLVRSAVKERGGQEVDTEGDAVFVAFPSAREGLIAAITAQQSILRHPWPNGSAVRVRMGLHTGEARIAESSYVGMDVHRAARICAAGHGGQTLLSDTVAALVTKDLPDGVSLRDLGEHRLKDLAHPHRLFQALAPDLPPDFPPLKSLEARPNNLRLQLSSFIGREHAIAEVKESLSRARLVTLTGAGGSGKTRLALKVAAEGLDKYADGVWWVDLGSLADLQLVPQTVASVLSIPEQPGRRLVDTLVDHLHDRTLLLVLDNCEHLLSACAELTDALLRHCPSLRILVTSREGLGIAGETLYPVPSLSVPGQRTTSLDRLRQYEAVQLFTERSTAVLASFRVTQRNADAVAQICRRLDGIPLAIELAAARVKVLPVEQIASRLDEQFRLLTGGSRVALPRHQTLRAAMDWSHNLLSEQERAMLRRLSVFAGGWTLEAAEAVCAGSDLAPSEVLDLLTHLVDKSLVIAEEHDGKGRYRFLETVRQYGRDRLLGSGDTDRIRSRHRDYFLALLEEAGPHIGWHAGAEQTSWLDRLEAEYDNLRAAMEWSLQSGDMDRLLGPFKTLEEFWEVRGYWSEGLQSLEPVLLATNGTRSSLRAWALEAASVWERRLGEISRAVALIEEAVAVNRALGDNAGLADSLRRLGLVMYRQGNYRRATALFEESNSLLKLDDRRDKGRYAFTLYLLGVVYRLRGDYQKAEALCKESLILNRTLGRTEYVARALDGLGLVALCVGDYDRASSLCQEALAIARQEGYKYGALAHLNSLGLISCATDDFARAITVGEEGLSLARDLGEKGGVARALTVLARAAFHQGHLNRAATLYAESLIIFRDREEKLGVAQCLEGLGVIAVRRTPDRAARLLAAAESVREAIGAPLPPFEHAKQANSVNCIRDVLSAPALTAAWTEGRAMTLEQAVEYALATDPD